MAEQIPFPPKQPTPHERLVERLATAPGEHAEALLDSLEILQLMRDKGILEIVKGLLGSGEQVLGVLTKVIDSQESVDLFRNLVILAKVIGGVNPEILEAAQRALSESAAQAHDEKTPGLFHLLRRLSNPDSRRVLNTVAAALESMGKEMRSVPALTAQEQTRRKVTRHRVRETH